MKPNEIYLVVGGHPGMGEPDPLIARVTQRSETDLGWQRIGEDGIYPLDAFRPVAGPLNLSFLAMAFPYQEKPVIIALTTNKLPDEQH